MICLTLKPSQNISKIIGVSSWSPSSLHLNPLDYATQHIRENKTNTTSNPNIGSLKTATEEEGNKISEEFILIARKSFQRHIDTKNFKMVAILSEFTVLCPSYFVVYLFKLKVILF